MLLNTYVFLIYTSILAKAMYSKMLQAFAFVHVRYIRLLLQEPTIVSNHARIELPLISVFHHLYCLSYKNNSLHSNLLVPATL